MSHLPDEAERACFAWVWNACADMESYVQMSLTRGDPDRRRELFGDTWSWLVTDSFNGLLEAHQMTNQDDEFAGPAGTSRSLDAALAEYAAAGTQTPGKTRRTSASAPPSSSLPSCFTCSRS